jgi:hypothetical protein
MFQLLYLKSKGRLRSKNNVLISTYLNQKMHKIHSWFIGFSIRKFQKWTDFERDRIACMTILLEAMQWM